MRVFNRLLAVAGVLALLTGVALTADKPQAITAEQGVGPGGVVESTLDFYPEEPEWTGPPRTTKGDIKKETPEEKALMERLKNLQLDVGHELATVLQAPPPSRGGGDGISAAPSLGTNFEGINQASSGGFIPPDPIMAAGPNHVVVAVNLRWAIYNKSGTQQFVTSISSWFNSVNTRNEGFSDPKVIYDHYSGRWIVMCIGFNDAAQVGSYFISVSDDSDPNGFWYKWATPGEKNGNVVTINFPDYPGIGYDSSEAVYLTSRQFPLPSGSFQYAKVRVLKKSELYRTDSLAPPLAYADFVNMTDLTTGTNVLTMKPAMCWGPIQGNFVVGSVNFSGSAHDIWKINNPAGAATMTRVGTAVLGSFSAPPNAGQPPPGCGTLINTVDARITGEVTYRNGHLYYVFNHAHNFGSGTVGAIRYVKTDTTGGVVDNIIYGADGEFMYFPNVTVTQGGGVAIGYSHSSTTSFASARYVGNFPGDLAQGTLKAGEGVYCLVAGGRNRWGDYSGCAQDPAFPRRVWVYNEFASSSNSWRTWTGFFTLQNHPPIIADPGPQTMDEGDTAVLNINAADPDGENIASFTILNPKPTWATFTNLGGGNGQLKLTPGFFDGPSIDTVRLRAADNAVPSMADTIIIEITVQQKNAAPLVAITPGDTVKLNQCQTAELLVTSSDPDASGAISIFPGSVPGFAVVTDSGSGTGGVALAPIETDLGDYTVQVASSDGNDTTTVSLPVHVYPRGDLNRDDLLTASDIVLQLNCVFLGTPPPAGGDSCDLDGGGAASTDVVQLLNAVFLGAALPPC